MDSIWTPVPKCGSSKLSAFILLSQIVSDAKCLSAAQRSTVSWPGDFHYPQQYPCYAIQGALRGGLQRPLFVFYTVHLPPAGNSWSSICFFHLFQFPLQTLYRFLFSLTTGNRQRCTQRGFCRRKWRGDNCVWTCHAGRTSMSTPATAYSPPFCRVRVLSHSCELFPPLHHGPLMYQTLYYPSGFSTLSCDVRRFSSGVVDGMLLRQIYYDSFEFCFSFATECHLAAEF